MLSFILLSTLFTHTIATPFLKSPLQSRQLTVVEVQANDPNDPNNVTPISTWIQSGSASTPIPQPQAQGAPPFSAPPPSTPSPSPLPSPSPSPSSAPKSGSGDGSGDGSPMSGSSSILSTINYWRKEYNLPTLVWNSTLQAAAENTGKLDGGSPSSEVHHPPPVTPGHGIGEVINPGNDNNGGGKWNLQGHSPFELAYFGWLCEGPPSQLGSNGQQLCDLLQQIDPGDTLTLTETGHYEILTTPEYTDIGCAFTKNAGADMTWYYQQGLWVCDLSW